LNGVETADELIISENGKIKKFIRCYDNDNIKCFAYDHFYWFDVKTGNKIDAP
jgi:hypothetical protein